MSEIEAPAENIRVTSTTFVAGFHCALHKIAAHKHSTMINLQTNDGHCFSSGQVGKDDHRP